MDAMQKLVASHPGVTPLSLQWMKRQRNSAGDVEEHFGFVDGTSNPELSESKAGERFSNRVNLGEILCGYPNLSDNSGGTGRAGLHPVTSPRRQLFGAAQASAGCRGA